VFLSDGIRTQWNRVRCRPDTAGLIHVIYVYWCCQHGLFPELCFSLQSLVNQNNAEFNSTLEFDYLAVQDLPRMARLCFSLYRSKTRTKGARWNHKVTYVAYLCFWYWSLNLFNPIMWLWRPLLARNVPEPYTTFLKRISFCSPSREWDPGSFWGWDRCSLWERCVAPHCLYKLAVLTATSPTQPTFTSTPFLAVPFF